MDQYGIYRNTSEDFQAIKNLTVLLDYPIVFSYSYDEVGCMIVMMIDSFICPSTLPFSGQPDGHVFVGVIGKGFFHLPKKELHPNYIGEKLCLGKSDAEGFAQLFNFIYKQGEEENVHN